MNLNYDYDPEIIPIFPEDSINIDLSFYPLDNINLSPFQHLRVLKIGHNSAISYIPLFTPFYISNADFYIVLNHIKIIYNSFLFFLFYSLGHIFLVFHKHP